MATTGARLRAQLFGGTSLSLPASAAPATDALKRSADQLMADKVSSHHRDTLNRQSIQRADGKVKQLQQAYEESMTLSKQLAAKSQSESAQLHALEARMQRTTEVHTSLLTASELLDAKIAAGEAERVALKHAFDKSFQKSAELARRFEVTAQHCIELQRLVATGEGKNADLSKEVSKLRSSLAEEEAKLQHLVGERKDLEQQVEALTAFVDAKTAKLAELGAMLDTANANARSMAEAHRLSTEDLQRQLDTKNDAIKNLSGLLENKDKALAAAGDAQCQLGQDLEELEATLRNKDAAASEEQARLQAEVADAKTELESTAQQLRDVGLRCDRLEEEAKQAKVQREELQRELGMAHDALKLAESKLVELKAEAAATLKETEDARRMELGRVIEDCCKKMEAERNAANQEITKLKQARLAESIEAEGKAKELEDHLQAETAFKVEAAAEVERLQRENEQLDKEKAGMELRLDEINSGWQTSKEELVAARAELARKSEELQTKAAELRATSDALRSTRDDLAKVQSQLKDKVDLLTGIHLASSGLIAKRAAQGGRTVDEEEDPLPRKHVHFTDVSDSGSEGDQEDMSQALALHDAGGAPRYGGRAHASSQPLVHEPSDDDSGDEYVPVARGKAASRKRAAIAELAMRPATKKIKKKEPAAAKICPASQKRPAGGKRRVGGMVASMGGKQARRMQDTAARAFAGGADPQARSKHRATPPGAQVKYGAVINSMFGGMLTSDLSDM